MHVYVHILLREISAEQRGSAETKTSIKLKFMPCCYVIPDL